MQGLYNRDQNGDFINHSQNIRNKTTVKKQLSHRLLRLNETGNKENQYHRSNLMTNLTKNTIRKSNQSLEQAQQKSCANHRQRDAQFIVKIDDQILNYCRKCATHIASQGFDVQKINTNLKNSNRMAVPPNIQNQNISAQILLPNISPSRVRPSQQQKQQQIQKQKRKQLKELTKSLKHLKSEYKNKSLQLTQICQTFDDQKQTLTNYYAELISYIEQIRDSHLQAIQETSINTIQICEIQKGQIEETIDEINQMIYDIESNMDKIVSQVDQHNYAECFDFYKQKEGIFSHRLQQLGSEAKPWPCTSEQQINNKIQSFKAFVNQLHEVNDDSSQNQNQEAFIY